MRVYPKDQKEEKSVVSLWIDHGKKPQDASYQYILLPASSTKKTASFDTESIQVISNTKEAQVVYLPKEKRVFIAVFSSLDVKLPFGVKFNCQQLGLFVFKYK